MDQPGAWVHRLAFRIQSLYIVIQLSQALLTDVYCTPSPFRHPLLLSNLRRFSLKMSQQVNLISCTGDRSSQLRRRCLVSIATTQSWLLFAMLILLNPEV